jgi:phage terminase small subunit
LTLPIPQRNLTEKQAAFVRAIGGGHSPYDAARIAGYSDPESDGIKALHSPTVIAAVHREVQRRLQADAAVNLKILHQLRNDSATPPRVRADIGLQLMKMAGHVVPTTAPDKQDKPLADMTREEMLAYIDRNQAEIDRAESELAARAKDVSAQVMTQDSPLDDAKPLGFLD